MLANLREERAPEEEHEEGGSKNERVGLTGEIVLVLELRFRRQLLGRLLLAHQRVVGLLRHLLHDLLFLLYVVLQSDKERRRYCSADSGGISGNPCVI